jgi:DNA-binding XRE family transcriptional regulator
MLPKKNIFTNFQLSPFSPTYVFVVIFIPIDNVRKKDEKPLKDKEKDLMKKKIAATVKGRRNLQQRSQEDLAHFAGLNVKTINRLEGRKSMASFYSIYKVAKGLNIDPRTLCNEIIDNFEAELEEEDE